MEVFRRGTNNGALLQLVPLQESEEESGDVPRLPARFSVCTSTDVFSIASVRDLEFRLQVIISALYYMSVYLESSI